MPEQHPGSEPDNHKRGVLIDEISALLQALQSLYLQVSSRLLHLRLGDPSANPGNGAADPVNIAGTLGEHLERQAAEAKDRGDAQHADAAGREHAQAHPLSARDRDGRPYNAPSGERPKHFHGRGPAADLQPHMREKMQANTLEHINKALRLAREGNAEGAKLHAQLAEHAMQTAGDYMPPEQYQSFREEVETRLRAILDAS